MQRSSVVTIPYPATEPQPRETKEFCGGCIKCSLAEMQIGKCRSCLVTMRVPKGNFTPGESIGV